MSVTAETKQSNLAAVEGRIFDVQTFSVHDGPGIRTTVFMKGCPLRCLWCHNPESMEKRVNIGFVAHKCIYCGQCEGICEHGGHSISDEGHDYFRERCVRCGSCVPGCPSGALEIAGRDVSAGDVLKQVMADAMFYERSGGGMTLSGGEPLNQPEFTKALLTLAHEENLHCTVDSSGFAPWEVAGPVFELADLVLYDLKTVDDDHHQELTGVSNKPILANLEKMLESDDGPSVWLRMPLIPGCNDSDETVSAMAELCSELSQHPRLERVYLMPYHKLAEGKYIQFGVEYGLAGLDSPSDENIKRVAAIFSDRGVTVRHD